LQVDTEILKQLRNSGANWGKIPYDADEHSLEMHLPFMKLCLNQDTKIVPIFVGRLTDRDIKAYGQALFPYFDRHYTFFIISSDFCHWGERFRFRTFDPKYGEI